MSIWRRILDVANFMFGGLFNIAIAVVVIVAAYTITVWAFEYGQRVLLDDEASAAAEGEYVIVEIPEEASLLEIARILRENELVNNEWIFYLNSILGGSGNHFRHGLHRLNTGMSESEIMFELTVLRDIPTDSPRIMIMEGLTNWQIADLAATLGYFSARDFLYEAENGLFDSMFLQGVGERANRLEGFLFPDTYYLPQNPTPRDLIIRMLSRFGDVFTPEMWLEIDALNERLGMNLGIEDIITVASIIEREAVVREERPVVAAIIYNRLAAGMPLEMVSTVVYATNTRQDLLTAQDFQINSPYNTFNRPGLPVGPISNPGLNAIEAALNPARVDYLFKVVNDHSTRSHFFTASREAYDAAVIRYQVQADDEDEDEEE